LDKEGRTTGRMREPSRGMCNRSVRRRHSSLRGSGGRSSRHGIKSKKYAICPSQSNLRIWRLFVSHAVCALCNRSLDSQYRGHQLSAIVRPREKKINDNLRMSSADSNHLSSVPLGIRFGCRRARGTYVRIALRGLVWSVYLCNVYKYGRTVFFLSAFKFFVWAAAARQRIPRVGSA
jgi:hypothetical protein